MTGKKCLKIRQGWGHLACPLCSLYGKACVRRTRTVPVSLLEKLNGVANMWKQDRLSITWKDNYWSELFSLYHFPRYHGLMKKLFETGVRLYCKDHVHMTFEREVRGFEFSHCRSRSPSAALCWLRSPFRSSVHFPGVINKKGSSRISRKNYAYNGCSCIWLQAGSRWNLARKCLFSPDPG